MLFQTSLYPHSDSDISFNRARANDAWHNALDMTLKQLGKQEGVTKAFFYENHVGVDMKKVISSHLKLSEYELERAVKTFINNFLSSIDYVTINDNVIDVLEYVSETTERMAINTNTYEKVVDGIFRNLKSRNLDIKKYFKTIVTRDLVEQGKPNPNIIFYACDKLDVTPENMVFVEDSVSGVQAGMNAGCYVVAIINTTAEEKLRSAGADKIITNLLELKNIISELSD
jgi:beta-phosphoglucomutase-like phosphatase (HAD superfamily)